MMNRPRTFLLDENMPRKILTSLWREGYYWIWISYTVFGTKVERFVVPLAGDIDDVIELRIPPAVAGYISASVRSLRVHWPLRRFLFSAILGEKL